MPAKPIFENLRYTDAIVDAIDAGIKDPLCQGGFRVLRDGEDISYAPLWRKVSVGKKIISVWRRVDGRWCVFKSQEECHGE